MNTNGAGATGNAGGSRPRARSRSNSLDATTPSKAKAGLSASRSSAPSSSSSRRNSQHGNGSGMSQQQVCDNIKTFLFAGHDTTASGLAWALYLITTHPEVEAKILGELSAEMPCFRQQEQGPSSPSSRSSSPRRGAGSPASSPRRNGNGAHTVAHTTHASHGTETTATTGLTTGTGTGTGTGTTAAGAASVPQRAAPSKVSEIRSLRYLDAVVKEVLRLCPSAGFTRRPDHDVEINGHTVPAGTEMVIFPWLLHQHPEMGEDAGTFNPDRWLERDPQNGKAKRSRQLYLPFSLGPRNCVGMQLALTEMKTALILLLQRYRFRLADTAAPPPKMVCLMTLFPSDIALVPERRIQAHHQRFQSSLKKSPSSLGFL